MHCQTNKQNDMEFTVEDFAQAIIERISYYATDGCISVDDCNNVINDVYEELYKK